MEKCVFSLVKTFQYTTIQMTVALTLNIWFIRQCKQLKL